MHTSQLTSLAQQEMQTLTCHEVHIWQAALDIPAVDVQGLANTLSADERQRAAQYRFLRDRQHFIVARGLLRTILGCYLQREAHMLRFSYSSYGKPALEATDSGNALCFNLAHSAGKVLYAITRQHNIGVDLEYMVRHVSWQEIATQFFSAYERRMLQAVPTSRQQEAFFHIWTQKEAYLKARGLGLSLNLDQFDVSVMPDEPAGLVSIREDAQDISRWSLHTLHIDANYAAALAVEGHGYSIKYWQWPPA